MAFTGFVVLIPTFFVSVWHYTTLGAGFAIAPSAVISGFVSPLAGRNADRFGHRRMCSVGAALSAVALAWWALRVGPTPHYWSHVFPAQVLSGVASGMTFSTFVSAAVRDVPQQKFALAGSARFTLFQMAVALGIAMVVALQGNPKNVAAAMVGYHRAWWLGACLFAACAVSTFALYPERRRA